MRAEPDTKDRILDAAERLFAERGIAGSSLRAVTAAAGVNVAAVHYHFGSKDDLIRAVIERRFGPVNRERLRRLTALEARGDPTPEELVAAFLGPPLALWAEGGSPAGLLLHEPVDLLGPAVMEVMGEVASRFLAAFERALPHLSRREASERMHLLVGVLVHLLSGRMAWSTHPLPARGADGMLRVLVRTQAAALRAPSVEENS